MTKTTWFESVKWVWQVTKPKWQKKMSSGEILMPGDPLLPVGRSIRIGSFPFVWTPSFSPCMVKLTHTQEVEIQKILKQRSCMLKANVKGNIPFFDDNQAKQIRDAIDTTKSKPGMGTTPFVANIAKDKTIADFATKYIGHSDEVFNNALESNTDFRDFCEGWRNRSDWDPDFGRREWFSCNKEIESFMKRLAPLEGHCKADENVPIPFSQDFDDFCDKKEIVTVGGEEVVFIENGNEGFPDLAWEVAETPLLAKMMRKRPKKFQQDNGIYETLFNTSAYPARL